MNIIYCSEMNWYKEWWRFDFLDALVNLNHKVTYIAPERLRYYIFRKKRRKVNNLINYQPYYKLGKNWEKEIDAMINIIKKNTTERPYIISNNAKRCNSLKDYFGNQAVVIYDVFDRYSEYGNEYYDKDQLKIKEFDEEEKNIMSKCDMIMCASQTLLKDAQKLNKNSFWFPNAVSAERILNHLPRRANKIVGLYSNRLSRIDTELLINLAQELPAYQIEIIGKNDVSKNRYPTNVIFLPRMPYDQLLKHINKWDCGLGLFIKDRFNHYCNPIKFFDYSAKRLPIVSTSIPEAQVFATLYPDILYLADNAQEFAKKIKKLDLQRDYTKLACENTWEIRAEELCDRIKILSESLVEDKYLWK